MSGRFAALGRGFQKPYDTSQTRKLLDNVGEGLYSKVDPLLEQEGGEDRRLSRDEVLGTRRMNNLFNAR